MTKKEEILTRDPVHELIEGGRRRRARIIQELLELRRREEEIEEEIYREAVELLKLVDKEDRIAHLGVYSKGRMFVTRKGKTIYFEKDGSIIVVGRKGEYIIGQRVLLV